MWSHPGVKVQHGLIWAIVFKIILKDCWSQSLDIVYETILGHGDSSLFKSWQWGHQWGHAKESLFNIGL